MTWLTLFGITRVLDDGRQIINVLTQDIVILHSYVHIYIRHGSLSLLYGTHIAYGRVWHGTGGISATTGHGTTNA
jgi:Fe-S cluster assembly iron-binding protein IscA